MVLDDVRAAPLGVVLGWLFEGLLGDGGGFGSVGWPTTQEVG